MPDIFVYPATIYSNPGFPAESRPLPLHCLPDLPAWFRQQAGVQPILELLFIVVWSKPKCAELCKPV